MKATLLIALLVGTGGATSFAAQGSVPGDTLYPVKVHVNENVRSALTFGADAEATLQAQLLKERIEEAEVLAAEGKLEGDTAVQVQANIDTQLQETLAASAEASSETAVAVKTGLSSTLAAFSNSLQSMQSTSVEAGVAADFATAIDAHIGSIAAGTAGTSVGTEIAGEISVETIVDGARARLEALETTVEEAVELSEEAKAEFDVKLEAAASFVAESQAELAAEAEAKAEASAQKANEILGEIESALSLMGQIEIDQSTGHIIDINFDGEASTSVENEADNIETDAVIEGSSDSSLQSDVLDASAQTGGGVTGSLGL